MNHGATNNRDLDLDEQSIDISAARCIVTVYRRGTAAMQSGVTVTDLRGLVETVSLVTVGANRPPQPPVTAINYAKICEKTSCNAS